MTVYSGYLHLIVGLTVLISTISAVMILVSHFAAGGSFKIDLENSHEKAGWSVVAILLVFTITGMVSFITKMRATWNSKMIRNVKWMHRILAYTMFGLVTYTIH